MLAGAGMLAWRWWKNRQASGSQQTTHANQSFTENTTRGADAF
jgi:predicted negative regulator of RcsB-dependent stress response